MQITAEIHAADEGFDCIPTVQTAIAIAAHYAAKGRIGRDAFETLDDGEDDVGLFVAVTGEESTIRELCDDVLKVFEILYPNETAPTWKIA